MELAPVIALINDDMRAVDQLIRERLTSDVVLINQISHYIINSGGKRLRPAVALLAARACGYSGGDHIKLAAITEFIHTATLLHDDVVDASEMRRAQQTANALWGNGASVLTGDYLYTRAFQLMVGLDRMPVMEIMADATNAIAEGEVLQLLGCHDPDMTAERYMDVIVRKTAKLFEAGARLGAVLGGQPREAEEAMADYGMHLGTAFQLVDDVLDYSASDETFGKNVGDDLAEGKATLPLIYAMRHGDTDQVNTLRESIVNGGRERIDAVKAAIESTGAIEYTSALARAEAERAVEGLCALPASRHKDALIQLAEFSVARTY